ncbi:MAG: DUF4159 domain-containing protein [Verrucomicrobia bacterium]|nr:DUF4159 domain-containing protein [Verrucomicrobiota bacterium]
MKSLLQKLALLLCGAGMLAAARAQFGGEDGWGRKRAPSGVGPIDRGNVPVWPLDKQCPRDVFTFARIKYTSSQRERSSYAWWTDFPDADLNLSFRLQELTALKVNPEPTVVELLDPRLLDYPWILMSGIANITLTEAEAKALGNYLLNGGFMMVDDFWGQAEWDAIESALKQALPGRHWVDLPRTHDIFHIVCDLPNDLSLQTPNIGFAIRNKFTGITWEDNHIGGNTHDAHFRAYFDDKDRMMVFLCHNTDNGDGWEEEQRDAWFFSNFSEKKNYPLAINVIFYAMTH